MNTWREPGDEEVAIMLVFRRFIRIALVLLVVLGGLIAWAVLGEIIPADRRVTWQGFVGAVKSNRISIVNVTAAPHNATGNGTTDDLAAINSALGAAVNGDVVYFPAGTYRVTGALDSIDKSITLDGDGPASSVIKYTGAASVNVVTFSHSINRQSFLSMTAGYTKDSTTLTLADASSIVAGDYLWVTQTNFSWVTANGQNNCTWCGHDDPTHTMVQVNKVLSKSGSDLTMEIPQYITFASAQNPSVREVSMLTGPGMTDLTVWSTNSAATSLKAIYFSGIYSGWISNVCVTNMGHSGIQVEDSMKCSFQAIYIHDGFTHGGDKSYGIHFFNPNSAHLVENCVFYKARHPIAFEGGGSGCVVAYCYEDSAFQDGGDDPNFMTGTYITHGSHPYMNLFEGLIGANLNNDNTLGSASHNTWFRCWLRNFSAGNGTDPVNEGMFAVEIEANNYSNNVVGCVIGQQGQTGIRYATNSMPTTQLTSYRMGWQTPGGTSQVDIVSSNSTYIHMSYDYIGGGTITNSGASDFTIPTSLYLSSKPCFMGDKAWPGVGPDLVTFTNANPGKLRFEAGSLFTILDCPVGMASAGVRGNVTLSGRATLR